MTIDRQLITRSSILRGDGAAEIEVCFWGTCYGFTIEEANELADELKLLVKNYTDGETEA